MAIRILLCFWFLITSTVSVAEEALRDPFVPYVSEAERVKKATTSAHSQTVLSANTPLQKYPLSNYTLIGIASTENDAIAVITIPGGEDLFTREGDLLGSEGGIIEKIHENEIAILINNRTIYKKITYVKSSVSSQGKNAQKKK